MRSIFKVTMTILILCFMTTGCSGMSENNKPKCCASKPSCGCGDKAKCDGSKGESCSGKGASCSK